MYLPLLPREHISQGTV